MIAESKFCHYCKQPVVIATEKRCKGKCRKILSIDFFSHTKNALDHRRHLCRECENTLNRTRQRTKTIERARLLLILIGRGFWEPEELRKQAGLKPQQFKIYIKRLLDKRRIVQINDHYEVNKSVPTAVAVGSKRGHNGKD